ncbi:hypothetical protein FSW04_13995 [Baekduia soli]|uniref:Uncharacterized protein n=1 Tax=Baekduia soli TaxID=496014 RepID=A0A5B8U6L1_9ACTN|nr:hypothetical protein [Baekduia soli]QEC48571.1 hypothetical protein FSW04_13995 [Baekduia soli]
MVELGSRVDRGFAESLIGQPGFESYALLDCGDGDVITITVFRDAVGAQRSAVLAREWAKEHLDDLALTRREELLGEILVSRASEELLEPVHATSAGRFASLRRYTMASGSVPELMRGVDDVFADAIADLDGFVDFEVIDTGGGELLSVTVLRDRAMVLETDEMALRFVTERLSRFRLQRTEVVGGEVVVSRAVAEMLEPTHA